MDDRIVQAVEEKIVGSGGNFVMQMAPKVRSFPDPAIILPNHMPHFKDVTIYLGICVNRW